jgi:hypothetical protein
VSVTAENHVGDQQQDPRQAGRKEHHRQDHDPVGALDQVQPLVVAEQDPVVDRGRQQQDGRNRDADQGCEVDPSINRAQAAKAGVERHDQEKREQNLDAGPGHPQFVQQLDRVPVQPLPR